MPFFSTLLGSRLPSHSFPSLIHIPSRYQSRLTGITHLLLHQQHHSHNHIQLRHPPSTVSLPLKKSLSPTSSTLHASLWTQHRPLPHPTRPVPDQPSALSAAPVSDAAVAVSAVSTPSHNPFLHTKLQTSLFIHYQYWILNLVNLLKTGPRSVWTQ